MKCNEKIHFRFMQTPCCGQLLCWVNPRLPNYCPECGKHIFHEVKSNVIISDNDAWLKYDNDANK